MVVANALEAPEPEYELSSEVSISDSEEAETGFIFFATACVVGKLCCSLAAKKAAVYAVKHVTVKAVAKCAAKEAAGSFWDRWGWGRRQLGDSEIQLSEQYVSAIRETARKASNKARRACKDAEDNVNHIKDPENEKHAESVYVKTVCTETGRDHPNCAKLGKRYRDAYNQTKRRLDNLKRTNPKAFKRLIRKKRQELSAQLH